MVLKSCCAARDTHFSAFIIHVNHIVNFLIVIHVNHIVNFLFIIIIAPVTIRHQFKARPINPEIFRSGGECGVRRVAIQPVTKAVSPCLTTKGRFSAKRGREEMEKEEEKREFKAR